MPTYGYECASCGTGFETFQKITDDPLTTCESCGGGLKKKIFPVGIVFKGSGFYVNDYAKKSGDEPAPAKTENAETAPIAPADGTKEPAAAPEAKPADTKTEAPAPVAAADAKSTA